MPRLIAAETDRVASLEELIDHCDRPGFDPLDEDCLAEAGPVLRALSNNRHFLCDLAIDELKRRCATQIAGNDYSAQVIMLRPPAGRYFLRANFWPSHKDQVLRSSGLAPFFYGIAHDHAFNFLTVGYLGPGYWSNYYEYDGAACVGHDGEAVPLRFTGTRRLEEGSVMLYRAHRDIHEQLPADALSVSLNIMGVAPDQAWRRQYLFDLTRGAIDQCMTTTSAEILLGLSVGLDDGNAVDLAQDFAAHHPSDAMRLSAWEALGERTAGDARLAHHDAGLSSSSPLIRNASRQACLQARPGGGR